jgi:hypothetical protein
MVEPPVAACSVVAPNGSLDLLGTLGRACSSSMYNLAGEPHPWIASDRSHLQSDAVLVGH